jgi:uncharacterized protein
MVLSAELLKILVCPVTKQKLFYDKEREELISLKAGLSFSIIDGIPILLADKAREVDPKRLKAILDKEKIAEGKELEDSNLT